MEQQTFNPEYKKENELQKEVAGVLDMNSEIYKTNCFVPIAFKDKGDNNEKTYHQEQIGDRIEFKEAIFENILPIKYNSERIGEELIIAFLKEDDSVIIGTLPEIESQLFDILNNNEFNEFAKGTITEELKLWGLGDKYYKTGVKRLQSEGINLQATTRIGDDNILTNNSTEIQKHLEEVEKNYKRLQKQYPNIKRNDFFLIKKNVIIGDMQIDIEDFLKINTIPELEECIKESIEKSR